jgi:hypothetical protein
MPNSSVGPRELENRAENLDACWATGLTNSGLGPHEVAGDLGDALLIGH